MATYERLANGEVVETVNTEPNSHEDNRLGMAALENTDPANGWRTVRFQEPPAAPDPTSPTSDPAPAKPQAAAKPKKDGA